MSDRINVSLIEIKSIKYKLALIRALPFKEGRRFFYYYYCSHAACAGGKRGTGDTNSFILVAAV